MALSEAESKRIERPSIPFPEKKAGEIDTTKQCVRCVVSLNSRKNLSDEKEMS